MLRQIQDEPVPHDERVACCDALVEYLTQAIRVVGIVVPGRPAYLQVGQYFVGCRPRSDLQRDHIRLRHRVAAYGGWGVDSAAALTVAHPDRWQVTQDEPDEHGARVTRVYPVSGGWDEAADLALVTMVRDAYREADGEPRPGVFAHALAYGTDVLTVELALPLGTAAEWEAVAWLGSRPFDPEGVSALEAGGRWRMERELRRASLRVERPVPGCSYGLRWWARAEG